MDNQQAVQSDIGTYSEVETPALLLDSEIMMCNLEEMASFSQEYGVDLRPHTKTHKCPELALKQIELGATGIAVAKLSEAQVMAHGGISDIQIANEVVAPEKILKLANLLEMCRITVAVDNRSNVDMISGIMKEQGQEMDVLLDIDVGLHRCGIPWEHTEQIIRFANYVDKKQGIRLKGIMTHAGQVYGCRNVQEVEMIGRFEGETMSGLARVIRKSGLDCGTISVGSTPTAMHSGKVDGVTEIRPGNYIFHDAIQVSLGVKDYSSCALSVLATVISTPSRNRVILDSGSKSLGTEKGAHGNRSIQGFGYMMNKKGVIKRLSEEHGFIGRIPSGESYWIGEKVRIIPNHACFVVNLYDRIFSFKENKYYQIEARGCNR